MHNQPRRHVIVGGTAGMGFATAAMLARSGDHVAILGRDPASATARASELANSTGGRVIGDGGSVGDAVTRAAAALGGIDGLAITAGPIHARGTLTELGDDAWAESFDTQLMTVVRAARAAIPLMQAGGGGSIVTVAAMSVRIQKPVLPHYAAMKAAIASLTKNIAKTYGECGIRANCIAPGAIDTEALDGTRARAAAELGGDPDTALWTVMAREWGLKASLNRIGKPDEVADLIAFLLSGKAGYLTGALINIDGGSDF